jgi:hypothetical protein
LIRDVPVTGLSGSAGSHRFFTLSVPPSGSAVQFSIAGGAGNANLYVKLNSMVSGTHYDCRSTGSGNSESCRFSTGGEYSIELIGNTAYSGVTLTGTFLAQSSVMACRTCMTSAQCIYGEHCVQDGASGPSYCAQDCADEDCPDGFSCDQTNASGWACRPDMGTCR